MGNQVQSISPYELAEQFQKFAIGESKSEAALITASQTSVSAASSIANAMGSQAKTLEHVSIATGVLDSIFAGLAILSGVGVAFELIPVGAQTIANAFKGLVGFGDAGMHIAQGTLQSEVSINTASAQNVMQTGQQQEKGVKTDEQIYQVIMRTVSDGYTVNSAVTQAA